MSRDFDIKVAVLAGALIVGDPGTAASAALRDRLMARGLMTGHAHAHTA